MKTINTAEFNQWLVHGYPGSEITYFQGHLAHDREGMIDITSDGHKTNHYIHHYFEPQHTLASEVYRAAKQGKCFLFQRRLDRNVFDYVAVKRRGPKVRVPRRILQ